MTVWKRMLVFVVLACVVMACIPASASAVDPVSAATMANALAQAVTAYGASQGVSMTFDVTNTDGIGEGVKELWDNFKEDVSDNDVPTYDSLAVTIWSTLFSKAGDKLAINLDANSVSYFDAFWNWLLSGPAEMQKVDDQYYQWSLNQSGEVDPIKVIGFGVFYNQPIPYYSGSIYNNLRKQYYLGTSYQYTNSDVYAYANASNTNIFVFNVGTTTYFVSNARNNYSYYVVQSDDSVPSTGSGVTSETVYYSNWYYSELNNLLLGVDVPVYDSLRTGLSAVLQAYNGNDPDIDSLSVMPYVGDAVPQDVYIPDNEDVNYEPIPVQIPIDVNWDDTLFGDGSGSLTDTQSEAATNALDNAITDNPAKTLELADTADPPAPAPGEVYIPFLPVTLPSFNFNFSGIWHYVVDWIGSLGAWFGMVLTVWSNLPYAMTVPVYACLVILIVLGVYRRFLS